MSHLQSAMLARGNGTSGEGTVRAGFLEEGAPHSGLQENIPHTDGINLLPTSWHPWLDFPDHTVTYSQSFGPFHIGENELVHSI